MINGKVVSVLLLVFVVVNVHGFTKFKSLKSHHSMEMVGRRGCTHNFQRIRRLNNHDVDSDNVGIDAKIPDEIEGYLNSDISSLSSTKQQRVFLYIALALLPCLFLVPFFMSREFVPPTDAY